MDKGLWMNKFSGILQPVFYVDEISLMVQSLLSSFSVQFSKCSIAVNTTMVDILISRLSHYWFFTSNKIDASRCCVVISSGYIMVSSY